MLKLQALVALLGLMFLLTACPEGSGPKGGSAPVQVAPATSSAMSPQNNVPKVSPSSYAPNSPDAPVNSGAAVQGSTLFIFDFLNMDFYDQNDRKLGAVWFPNGAKSTQLCGPASTAMALGAVLNKIASVAAPYTLPTSSWIARNKFDTAIETDRILKLATAMGTSPTDGTLFSTTEKVFMDRAPEFTVAGHVYSTSSQKPFLAQVDSAILTNAINPGDNITAAVPVLMYGHYYPEAKIIGGKSFTFYRRKGGHFITLPGYQKDSFGTTFEVHDPLDKGILKLYPVNTFSSAANQFTDLKPTVWDPNKNAYTANPDSINPSQNTSRYRAVAGLGFFPTISSDSTYAIIEGYGQITYPLH
jgi:hypothetical protein